ncbi:hypothetical protein DFQ28_004742, partial [Apophysomyces sp. BC1034]
MVSHAGAKPANNVVSSLVPRDLPSLQLAGGSRWNAKKEVYESARAFVRAFAAQLKAYGLSLDEHWERLLVLCLNNSQQIWYDDKLGKRGLSWSEAEAILVAKFDTPIHRCRAMVETFATEQRRGESLAAYVERFQTQRLVSGCIENEHLVARFIASLRPEFHNQACYRITSEFGDNIPQDMDK